MKDHPITNPILASERTASKGTEPRRALITRRAILLGFLLQIIVIFWIAHTELTASSFLSSSSIIMPAVLLIFMIIPLNRLLAWRFPHLALTRAELLLSYVMIGVSAVITGYGMIQVLLPAMGSPFYFATPENGWAELHRLIPTWLSVRDPAALKGLFQGVSVVPWSVWIVPLLAWFTFIMAFVGAMLCTSLLLSHQWIKAERLTFPVVAVPLEMTNERTPLFRNRLMWIGFLIPASLNTLGVLHYWFPAIPEINLGGNYKDLFVSPPWNGVGELWVGLSPFVIALAFLPPADISFSVWFFFILGKAIRVWGVYMGLTGSAAGAIDAHGFPYAVEQCVGAFAAFGGFILWKGYPGLKRALLAAWRREGDAPEDVALNRRAVFGQVICVLYLMGFLYLAGLSLHWAFALIVFCLLVAMVLARVRAETGTPWAYGLFGLSRDAGQTLVTTFGSQNFSPTSLATIGVTQWFYMDPRFMPMAHHTEALKIGDAALMSRGRLAAVILLATATGVLLGYYTCLTASYQLGIGTAKVYSNTLWCAQWHPNLVAGWLANRTKPDFTGMGWMAGAGLFTLLLTWARQSFAWWPFHPIGYVVAETGTPYYAWSQYFVAWLLKILVLRYGGMRLYLKAVPLMIGMILGHIITVTAWSAAGWLLHLPLNQMM